MPKYRITMERGFSDKRRCLTRETPGGRKYFFFKDQYLNFDTDNPKCIGHAEDVAFFKSDDVYKVEEISDVRNPILARENVRTRRR